MSFNILQESWSQFKYITFIFFLAGKVYLYIFWYTVSKFAKTTFKMFCPVTFSDVYFHCFHCLWGEVTRITLISMNLSSQGKATIIRVSLFCCFFWYFKLLKSFSQISQLWGNCTLSLVACFLLICTFNPLKILQISILSILNSLPWFLFLDLEHSLQDQWSSF